MSENRRYRDSLCSIIWLAILAALLSSAHSYGQQDPRSGQSPAFGGAASGGGTERGWSIVPRLNIRGTYSDNIRLRTDGADSSDFVTQINPGVSVYGVGRRFTFVTDYMMNNLIYANQSGLSRMRHQLNSRGTAELIENLFFLDGTALMMQQNASLFGPQGLDNVNVTGNRANVSTYTVSPYLRHRFQGLASGQVRYTYGIVESSAQALRNSERHAFQASLNSGDDFQVLGWGVNYDHQMINFSRTGRTVELERTMASLQYKVTSQFSLMASGGYERNSFLSIRGSPSSPTWTVGFSWLPNERTSVMLNAGQRFFGDTYSALLNHRTRMTVWNLTYDENITTFNQQTGMGAGGFGLGGLGQLIGSQNPGMGSGPSLGSPGLGPGFPGGGGSFLDPSNFLTNRLFLQKRLQVSVGINGKRHTFMLRGFNMTRRAYSPESDDIGLLGVNTSLLNNTRQSGASATWSYRVSALTQASLNVGFTRYAFLSTDREDDFIIGRATVSRNLRTNPMVQGMLEFRHVQRDSNQAAANYRENAVTAFLNMSF